MMAVVRIAGVQVEACFVAGPGGWLAQDEDPARGDWRGRTLSALPRKDLVDDKTMLAGKADLADLRGLRALAGRASGA